MSNSQGRGRGRGRPNPMSRAPDKAALDRVQQETASVKSGTHSPVTPEQVADPPDCTSPGQMASPSDQPPLQEQETPATSQQASDEAETTIGKGEVPPLAEQLKKTLQGGVEVATPPLPSTVTISAANNKLNPAAADFVPKSVTLDLNSATLDLNSAVFTPPRPQTGTPSPPIFTKHAIPTSTSSSTSSKLDPSSKEFVPSGYPPADLPGMMQQPAANGDQGLYGNGDFFEEELGDFLTVKDIVQGYEKAAPTRTDDIGSEPILKGAAEMLLKVCNYPGSFDEIGKNFRATLENWMPSDSTLANLAEMLVHWGVRVTDFRYPACRMCELIADIGAGVNDTGAGFVKALLSRLQAWHKKCYDTSLSTNEEKYLFACYSGFFAEIFAKIKFENKPINVLCPHILKYVKTLLSMREDFYVREACNILKLTGSTLVHMESYNDTQMVDVVKMMNELVIDRTLSKTCTSLIMQVIELSGSKWTISTAPVKFESDTQTKMGAAGLNTNAPAFVPLTGPPCEPNNVGMLFSETFYDQPIIQQPVSCAADWDEFVGDDQPVEASNNSPDIIEDDYDGLDPDIELEMEAFIDEIEEHLMLQDFDPELQQDISPGKD